MKIASVGSILVVTALPNGTIHQPILSLEGHTDASLYKPTFHAQPLIITTHYDTQAPNVHTFFEKEYVVAIFAEVCFGPFV
ncbi:MAG: hypothetical protein MUC61_02570 [Amoebophilaceae bacterium]|nr:hypothetical protein [Amoebophilaceae bacterium]